MQTHRNMLHNILRYTTDSPSGPASGSRAGITERRTGIVTAWCALMNGATLVSLPAGRTRLIGLADWLERERITYSTRSRRYCEASTGRYE